MYRFFATDQGKKLYNVDLCTLYDVLTYLGVEWAVLEISWLYFVSKVYNRHEREFT